MVKQKINKIMNFRFAFCTALAVIVSIVLSCYVFVSQKMKLALILIFAGVFLLLFVFFAFFKKKFLVILLTIVFIGIIPAVSIYFKSDSLNKNGLLLSEKNTYSGKIYSLNEDLDRNAIFIELSDVEIIDGETRKEFKGKIYVRLVADGTDTSKLDIGKYVTVFNSEIERMTLDAESDKFDYSYISRGITARSFVFSHNLKVEEKTSLSVKDRVKNSVYENFKETDTMFTDIGFAMLFGETEILEDGVHSVFKDAGVAHLLAVSGFHISVIVSFLAFILNKLKANKYLKFSIIAGLLTFYVYLCAFSPSAVRASLMALMLLYATNRNKEYDKLSALSLSLVFILLINPMQMFSVSFVLSFVSILSIILLMPIFERFFSKFLSEKFASSLSITLAVSLGLFVFQLYYFGSYPILNVISNLLTIPIVGILFIFLIISVIIGPLFGVTPYLIEAFGFCMKFIVQFNNWIVKNGLYIICGGFSEIALVLSVLFMFVISDYVFLKKRIKLPLAGILILALVLVII